MEGVIKRHHGAGISVTALAGVTLEIWEGELLAIVGRAGSGKTSLLFALGGIERPDEGRIAVDGYPISELPAKKLTAFRRQATGWMFQEAALVSTHTALENIVLSLRLAGLDPSEAHARAMAALEAVELAPRAHHHPGELSGGEQQRVALARALAKRPRLLLVDEPTSRLDSQTARIIAGLLRRSVSPATTLVLATHDLDLAAVADRQVTMDSGRLAT